MPGLFRRAGIILLICRLLLLGLTRLLGPPSSAPSERSKAVDILWDTLVLLEDLDRLFGPSSLMESDPINSEISSAMAQGEAVGADRSGMGVVSALQDHRFRVQMGRAALSGPVVLSLYE